MRIRGKRFAFTLNNPSGHEEYVLQHLVGQGMVTYIIFGKETGESGTPHLQGYLELKQRTGLRKLKRHLGTIRIHLEKANGSLEQNRAYCSKEDTIPFEDGTPMQQVIGVLATQIHNHYYGDIELSNPLDYLKFVINLIK